MNVPEDPGPPLEYLAFLGVVGLQRLTELLWSRRNLRRSGLAAPTPAEGRAAFAAMVALHCGLVILPACEVALRGRGAPAAVFWTALAVFILAQGLRYWTLATLGRHWNVLAVVHPDQPVIHHGPYRLIRHPNYLAVVLEFLSVPAAGGAWISLAALNLLHAPVLVKRIKAEEARLLALPGYQEAMGAKGRLLPRPTRRRRT